LQEAQVEPVQALAKLPVAEQQSPLVLQLESQ
jgi:hypothetical protein